LTLRATEAVTGTAVPVGACASAWNSTRYTPGWATFTAPLPGAWVRFVPKPATSVLKSSGMPAAEVCAAGLDTLISSGTALAAEAPVGPVAPAAPAAPAGPVAPVGPVGPV